MSDTSSRSQPNPVMLITGASRGIGRAVAELAADRQYDICINYRNDDAAAESLLQSLQRPHQRVLLVKADISSESGVLSLYQRIDEEFDRLDVLINNAGILHGACRLEDFTAVRIEQVFQTNVIGAMLTAREAVKRMSTRFGGQGGSIVNVSSIAALLGSPDEYIDYASTKGAMDTMTIGLAKEVAADGVRVNAVRPGLIYTDIHASGGDPQRVDRLKSNLPMQRGGHASEVAEAVLWLASDAASYVTGSFINVSGGR